MEQEKRSRREQGRDAAIYVLVFLLMVGALSGTSPGSLEVPEPSPSPPPATPTKRGINEFYATSEALGTRYTVPVRPRETPTHW